MDRRASLLCPRKSDRCRTLGRYRREIVMTKRRWKGLRLTSITHGPRVFIPVPCSTHIAGLVYDFYREAKAEQGVELVDAAEAGADDKGVEVELFHLCFSVKSISGQLKILPPENNAFLSIS
jgi:hypothetical protein